MYYDPSIYATCAKDKTLSFFLHSLAYQVQRKKMSLKPACIAMLKVDNTFLLFYKALYDQSILRPAISCQREREGSDNLTQATRKGQCPAAHC